MIASRCRDATLRPAVSSPMMAEMQFRATAIALVSAVFLSASLSPQTVFAGDSPPVKTVVITPGSAGPPSSAGKRTVTLDGPFGPIPRPASKKGSKQPTSTPPPVARPQPPPPPPPPPPPATSKAVVAPPPAPRVAVRKQTKSRQSVRGGASQRVVSPTVARGGRVVPADPPVATPAALATKLHRWMKWAVPVIGLVGLLVLFVVIRFAYWRWAIHRSRRQVIDSMRGESAPKRGYALYRGRRR
jgi:hypothetical protein